MTFEPINTEHAIQRALFSIVFDRPVGDAAASTVVVTRMKCRTLIGWSNSPQDA